MGLLDKIKGEKQINNPEEKYENLMEGHVALANAVLELAIKAGVAKTDSVLKEQTVDTLITFCEKMEDAAVKRELVEIMKEAGEKEVKKQETKEIMANITPEQAKTLLQSGAHHALSLNQKERKEHYKNVQEKQGQKALDKLLAEVRKQRTKSNALEM